MTVYDVVVIGGGIIGAAVLHALAQQGKTDCLLLEKDGAAAGATGRSGGMMRVFHRDPWLSDRTVEGMTAFRRFMAESGQTCGFTETGALYVASAADGGWVSAEVSRLQAQGVAMHLWTAREARRHLPAFRWHDDDLVVYEPHAGYADPLATTEALLQRAQDLGATVATGRQVTALRTGDQGIEGVETADGFVAARTVVVAAGAWSVGLLRPLGLGDTLYAKSIQVSRLQTRMTSTLPCWLDLRTLGFGRSGQGGEVWTGVGLDERDIAPGAQPWRLEDGERAKVLAAVHLPDLQDAPLLGGSRIADAYTTDRRGLLGPVPRVPGLVLATGWGGTGFMIALAIGQHVAAGIGPSVTGDLPSIRRRFSEHGRIGSP